MGTVRLFKNILIILVVLTSVNFAFADSYIMIAPTDITSVECENQKVVTFNILSTLLNEKKSVIVTSVSDGVANFTIKLKNKKCDYKASVQNGKLDIKGDRFIKILSVDLPPEITSQEVKN